MMRIVIYSLVFASLLSAATEAHSIVLGGSNLPLFGYPDHSCYKPSKPYKPYRFYNQYEIDSYNMEVDNYNSELERYLSCIEEYLENAKNDIKRIKEKMEEVVDEDQSP